ncbi:MAG: hypothetical protein EHM32_10330 [Spirochaetales bacterium]|nr:MAG: hypothetical protein EHM32_10330 [Spirochaetales bacterium]
MDLTGGLQSFELGSGILSFDFTKGILVCRDSDGERRKRWVKKLEAAGCLGNVIEDDARYYLACENGDAGGHFLALDKLTGATEWFIPGKSFLQLIYNEGLYLIFVDGSMRHYLLRVDTADGAALWHHGVDEDLSEYSFRGRKIVLRYASGRVESLDTERGVRIS